MSRIDASAELLKLGHQLGVPASRLQFLATVPADDLRALRGQIGEVLFRADKQHFAKIAAIAKIMPTAVAAKLAEHVLSPLLAARTAELLDPARAVDMITHLSPRYVADVSVAMDPGRAPEVLAQTPPSRVTEVAAELAARREWVVIGAFVSAVSPEALRASIAALDGEQWLRVGFVLEDMSRLDSIVAMLTDAQVDRLFAAAADKDLWSELEELLLTVDAPNAARLAARFARADDATVHAVGTAVSAGALSPAAVERLAVR